MAGPWGRECDETVVVQSRDIPPVSFALGIRVFAGLVQRDTDTTRRLEDCMALLADGLIAMCTKPNRLFRPCKR